MKTKPPEPEVGQWWRDKQGTLADGRPVQIVRRNKGSYAPGWWMSHDQWWEDHVCFAPGGRCEQVAAPPGKPEAAKPTGFKHLGVDCDETCPCGHRNGAHRPNQGGCTRCHCALNPFTRLMANTEIAAAPSRPPRREVSHDGRTWVPYELLTDADPFESYRHRRDGSHVFSNEGAQILTRSRIVGRYSGEHQHKEGVELRHRYKMDNEHGHMPVALFPDISPKAGPTALADWKLRVASTGRAGKGML